MLAIPAGGQPNGQQGPNAPTLGTQGGVGGPSASPPGGTPKRMMRQRAPNTFAGMQQQGVARPSPQMVQQRAAQQVAQPQTALAGQVQNMAAQGNAVQQYQPDVASAMSAAQNTVDNAAAGRSLGTYRTAASAQALGTPLMTQVMNLLADPTQGLNEAAQSNFDRLNRGIGREFTDLRENLNENMAARGLDASTIAASKLGELGARQAEAQGDLAARIQEKLINDRASAMNSAINAALGLRGQEAELGRDEYVINRDTGELEFQRGMQREGMGLQRERFGFDQEMGRGNLALGRENLALGNRRLDADLSRDARDFDYRVGRDSVGDARDARDFGYRTGRDAVMDGRYADERDYARGRDTLNDGRYMDERDYARGRDTVNDAWRQDERNYTRGRDTLNDERYADERNYTRGRDTVNDTRWQQGWDRDESRFQQQQNNFNTQGLMSLLQGMGFNNLSPGVMDQLLRALGVPGGSANGLPRPVLGAGPDLNNPNAI